MAVEGLFYGDPGRGTVDDEITKSESRFAPLINGLLQAAETAPIENSEIADFITHLSVRRKRLREALRESSEFIFNSLLEHMEKPSNLVPMLKKYIQTNIEITNKQKGVLLKQLSSGALTGRIAQLSEQVFPLIKRELQARLPGAVASGHLAALGKSVVPEVVSAELQRLRWWGCVISSSETQLILGDAGPITLMQEGEFRAIADKPEDVEGICLPISSDRFVFGSRHGSIPAFNPGELNLASSRCSGEYFVCPTEETGREYASHIGETSFLFSPDEHDRLLEELLSELR